MLGERLPTIHAGLHIAQSIIEHGEDEAIGPRLRQLFMSARVS